MDKISRLKEIAWLFLKLGTIGFGGPPATIAMMESEVVNKRKWVSSDYFLDMLASTNIVPGPNATEMAAHLGYIRGGIIGLFIAGLLFITPATIITIIIALLYKRYEVVPEVKAFFWGINPAVVAIILTATFRLGKSALHNIQTIMIAFLSFLLAFLGIDEVLILIGAGFINVLFSSQANKILLFIPLISTNGLMHLYEQIDEKIIQLGLFFLKVGALLFGSTYVMIAFMQNELINTLHWVTQKQLIDAISIGQITPGPMSTAATFIGYQIAEIPGALVATLGVFLPSFFIVMIVGRYLPKLSENITVKNFLSGISSAAISLIFYVSLPLIRTTFSDPLSILIMVFSLLLLIRYNIDQIFIVSGGAFIGIIYHFILST